MTTGLPLVNSTQRCLDAVEALAARWHAVEDSGTTSLVKLGQQIGYTTAIAEVLGVEYKAARAALKEGKL